MLSAEDQWVKVHSPGVAFLRAGGGGGVSPPIDKTGRGERQGGREGEREREEGREKERGRKGGRAAMNHSVLSEHTLHTTSAMRWDCGRGAIGAVCNCRTAHLSIGLLLDRNRWHHIIVPL